jgi:hypothetical protein
VLTYFPDLCPQFEGIFLSPGVSLLPVSSSISAGTP